MGHSENGILCNKDSKILLNIKVFLHTGEGLVENRILIEESLKQDYGVGWTDFGRLNSDWFGLKATPTITWKESELYINAFNVRCIVRDRYLLLFDVQTKVAQDFIAHVSSDRKGKTVLALTNRLPFLNVELMEREAEDHHVKRSSAQFRHEVLKAFFEFTFGRLCNEFRRLKHCPSDSLLTMSTKVRSFFFVVLICFILKGFFAAKHFKFC